MMIKSVLKSALMLLLVSSSSSSWLKLFEEKRLLQLDAVHRLQQLPDEQSHQLIVTMMSRIIEQIENNRAAVESLSLDIISEMLEESNKEFLDNPNNKAMMEKAWLVCENTCFMADLILRFPDFTKLKLSDAWLRSLNFGLQLIDNLGLSEHHVATQKLVFLVRQELELIKRDDDYVNVNSKSYKDERERANMESERNRAKREKEKEKKERRRSKRGPKLVRTEF